MLMSIFILLFIQGLVSSEESNDVPSGFTEFKECFKFLKRDDANGNFENIIPNSEEILAHCPSTKEFIDCRITHHSPEYDFQYNFGDYIIIKNFLNEICDDQSSLHKAYVAHFDCFKSMIDEWNNCRDVASDVFADYHKSSFAYQLTDIDDLDDDEQEDAEELHAYREYSCLANAYQSACTGIKILEKCGSDALDTYAEMFVAIRASTDFCGTEQENPYMKGFLDFLTKEDKLVENVMIRTLFEVDEE